MLMHKISLLTTNSIPLIGGISDYLHNLLSASISGVDWAVYSTIPKADFDDSALPYPMIRLKESRCLGKRLGDSFFLSRKFNTLKWKLNRPEEAKRLIKQILQKDEPDYIAIGRWCEQTHFWCRACQNLGMPYIMFAYGWELVENLPELYGKRRRKDFCSAQKIISISSATTKELISLGVDKSRIILVPPGVEPKKLLPLSEVKLQQILEDLALGDERYILAVGRLVKRKGFDLAIRAFANVAKDFPDISLVIAGDGPEVENLKSIADEVNLGSRIRLLGEVTEEQKSALFQNCEFFIMPNRPILGDMEGFGIVFLEAGIFGKAVIGGDNGGVPDAVVHRQTGLLVDTSRDEKPLSEAMVLLLTERSLSKQMGENGRLRAVSSFDWQQIATNFVSEINKFNGVV